MIKILIGKTVRLRNLRERGDYTMIQGHVKTSILSHKTSAFLKSILSKSHPWHPTVTVGISQPKTYIVTDGTSKP